MFKSDHNLDQVVSRFLPLVKKTLPPYKLRALQAIKHCRTQYMGGHVEACSDCGEIRTAFNSCRNRHCPKCGAIEKEKWVLAREADMLPVKYFHVVFTVPHKLNTLFMNNQKVMYNLLFKTCWQVLSDFGSDKKWIGGKMGASAILHTWGQNMQYHPHLHFIVPAGALMFNGKWKSSRNRGNFLFKTHMISGVFRSRLVACIRLAIKNNEIIGKLPRNLFKKDWVVYTKQPLGGPQRVIKYLSRYTHRTAISNDRILNVTDKTVTFKWKDYKQNYKKQISTLKGDDFLQLFCHHILPPGYTRIRHYGFLSSAAKCRDLPLIRKSLKSASPKPKKQKTTQEILFERMGVFSGYCKCCGGSMTIIEIIPDQFHTKARAPPKELIAKYSFY